MSFPRIPFARAIADRDLFASAWEQMHPEQRAMLKMLYGLPLEPSELPLWHALNGAGIYDECGFLVDVDDCGLTPPTHEFEDATFVIGRRGTKTSISSFILAYEAVCGGHKQHLRNPRQEPRFIQVAQDLATAKANLRQHILPYIESSPVGREELGDPKKSVTADTIRLANCGLIVVAPPNIKVRGQAVPVAAGDEIAFWQKDKESAAPDFEVINAITPGMAQFPDRKLLKMSSPWTKEGVLWKDHSDIGTYGRHLTDPTQRRAFTRTLVLKAPSATVNPTLSRRAKSRAEAITAARTYLTRERAKDANAFSREFLAEFSDSVSGFLPVPLLRRAATDQPGGGDSPAPRRRTPRPGVRYVASMDPGFRGDAFAFCIGHMEGGAFVQDVMEGWRGSKEQPLSPHLCLALASGLCKEFAVTVVSSDQHHLESVQEIAQTFGLTVEPHIFTNQSKRVMWSEFITLLHQDKLRLLSDDETMGELAAMERILSPNGSIRYAGKRDDRATVLAMCTHRALQYGETHAPVEYVNRDPTPEEVRAFAAARYAEGRKSSRNSQTQRAWYNR